MEWPFSASVIIIYTASGQSSFISVCAVKLEFPEVGKMLRPNFFKLVAVISLSTIVLLLVVYRLTAVHNSALLSSFNGVFNDTLGNSRCSECNTSFLTFMEMDEQLSSNAAKFLQLSYFSALWNLSMIEPWIEADTNFLSSLPPTDKSRTSCSLIFTT